MPLVSLNALHQLHIFVFFLAVFHVAYSAITMALGRAKVSRTLEFYYILFSSDFKLHGKFLILDKLNINYVLNASFMQIRRWKEWEKETSSTYYEFSNGILLIIDLLLCYLIFSWLNLPSQ